MTHAEFECPQICSKVSFQSCPATCAHSCIMETMMYARMFAAQSDPTQENLTLPGVVYEMVARQGDHQLETQSQRGRPRIAA
ncbi:hypothetical protein [Sagittula salina]|uniref:Uncharacterized protein n=1 Tax=Sagittula salina TaxID=2820268 RepID=A0A940MRT0_9RHOB|nr:hypothetical protein [Sagittula salina]MBP0483631.1 hypothetical protein [Sagittula salina]